MSDGDASDGDREAGDAAESAVAPDDAFAALGDETRLRTVRELAAAEGPLGFTELFERVVDDPAKPSAGFAYHLRKLNGRYVDTDDEGRYRLTFAGRQAARALAAGVYTERVDRDPEGVDGDCPVCGAASLEARIADNHVAVACVACGTELLALPFPPSGVRGRDTDAVLDAFDAYHRARLRQLADGVCPDCAGRAAGRIAFVEPTALPGVPEGSRARWSPAPARSATSSSGCRCRSRSRTTRPSSPSSTTTGSTPATVPCGTSAPSGARPCCRPTRPPSGCRSRSAARCSPSSSATARRSWTPSGRATGRENAETTGGTAEATGTRWRARPSGEARTIATTIRRRPRRGRRRRGRRRPRP
ncbi:winged helix-turn-helix domain-containing protein [Halobaculum litoreum]|uniref:Winged helix-turn-helix domain-containing protein n=1 Tax=Halobaculum litoreum TaxID=3031998 RepID=A0ABD5XY88_9EURY